jgi:hypothetical protein
MLRLQCHFVHALEPLRISLWATCERTSELICFELRNAAEAELHNCLGSVSYSNNRLEVWKLEVSA